MNSPYVEKNDLIVDAHGPFYIMASGLVAADWRKLDFPKKINTLADWRAVEKVARKLCGDWSDKDSTHNYLDIYWNHTRGRNMKVDSLLEIGVKYGHSLCMWNTWFESPKITGIDIILAKNHSVVVQPAYVHRPKNGVHQIMSHRPPYMINLPDNITLIEADICKYRGLDEQKYDVIVDDGSHKPEEQLFVLNKFYKNLNKNGVLFIEDIQSPDVVDYLGNNFIGNKNNLSGYCASSSEDHRRSDRSLATDSNMLVYINK